MARKLKANGEAGGDPAISNSGLRKEQLSKALKETYEIDCQLKVLADRHLQPLRDKKSKIKKGLRDNLQITAKVFNSRYFGYRLECEAQDAEDTATLDNIREMYAAAPVNTTIDMIDALEEKEDEGDEEAPEGVPGYTEADLNDLRENGRQAVRLFRDRETGNPHGDAPELSKVWLEGFDDETAKAAGEALGGGRPEAA